MLAVYTTDNHRVSVKYPSMSRIDSSQVDLSSAGNTTDSVSMTTVPTEEHGQHTPGPVTVRSSLSLSVFWECIQIYFPV